MTAATEMTNDAVADWAEASYDPLLPLMIDLGCGMCISLLGLSLPPDDEKHHDRDGGRNAARRRLGTVQLPWRRFQARSR